MYKDQKHTMVKAERIRQSIKVRTELLGSSTAGDASAAVGLLLAVPAGAAIGGATDAALSEAVGLFGIIYGKGLISAV